MLFKTKIKIHYHKMKYVKIRTFFEWEEKDYFTHPVVIAKWCCTAGVCLLGLQWEKTQQRGYLGPQSQDGSPQRSAGPAIQGRPRPCSPHFAGMYTWNYAGHSVFSAETSPPANSRKSYVSVVSMAIFTVHDVPYLTRWSKTLKASRARSGY